MKRRSILFRLAAILLGLSPLLFVELSLRVYGWGTNDFVMDPYVGFSSVRPLFERNELANRYEIASSRQGHFFPASFAATKSPKEVRIFCIGDSTVQGNPWEPPTSFAQWLELSLQAADPTRQWQVINCGGISYASYRMVPIVAEALRYQPDLIILHCSHNEFLEERTYEHWKRIPQPILSVHEHVSKLRTYNLLQAAMVSLSDKQHHSLIAKDDNVAEEWPILPAEVQALLDYRGGLEFYHRDDTWQRDVIKHYEFNVRRMVRLARHANVALLLMNPACQLRDSPPFKAENRQGMSPTEHRRWNELWDEARSFYATEPRKAIERLREALNLDDQHAGMHYDLAKCYDKLGHFASARAEYLQAKELDVCPLRILESMNKIVLEVSHDTNTPVVDVRALFDGLSRNGIPGSDWFSDHVHPTIPGYQRMADALVAEMVHLGLLRPDPHWQERKQKVFREHFNSLPPNYFTRAQERLRNLMLWAHGRTTKDRDSAFNETSRMN